MVTNIGAALQDWVGDLEAGQPALPRLEVTRVEPEQWPEGWREADGYETPLGEKLQDRE